jgi:hypothetical protein
MQKLTKFMFKVRCKNGFIVNNLKINGLDFDHARARLEQMYPRCTLLNHEEIKGNNWPTTEINGPKPSFEWLPSKNSSM